MIATRARSATLGIIVPCLALSCSQGAGSTGGEQTEGPQIATQSAGVVLGFEAEGWSAQGDNVAGSAVEVDGQAAFNVSLAARASLRSAPFAFMKTPNLIELEVRGPGVTAANIPTRIEAFLSCASRNVTRASVGAAQLGSRPTEDAGQVRLVVPEQLQTALAGGCENLQVELSVDGGGTSGTYVFDHLNLRATTPPIAIDKTPLCGLPDMAQLLPGATELPDGYMDYQAWIATPVMREEFAALEAALEPYERTVLGPATDHVNKQIVVVVDRSELDSGRLLSALQSLDLALPLRLQSSCHPVADLRAARDYVLSRPTSANSPTFTAHTDPAQGRFVMTVDPGTPLTSAEFEATQPFRAGVSRLPPEVIHHPTRLNEKFVNDLKQRFADALDVRWGRTGRTGRLDDGQPHYGAAAIGEAGFNFCTSGFVAMKDGLRGAVTAGHCYVFLDSPGGQPEANLTVTSGPKTYGVTGNAASYPLFDMMRINPGGQQFTNIIHTDPGTLTRVQVGKKNPVAGVDIVCASGAISRAKCSISVISNDCVASGPGGVTSGLTLGRRTGAVISQSGDSGAPVYQPSGATGAIINGLLISQGPAGSSEMCFHRVGTVESQLGVTVAL
jgi:hypothetical protein